VRPRSVQWLVRNLSLGDPRPIVTPNRQICTQAIADLTGLTTIHSRQGSDFLPERKKSYTAVACKDRESVSEHSRTCINMRYDNARYSAGEVPVVRPCCSMARFS
jgi:hypothetical protein